MKRKIIIVVFILVLTVCLSMITACSGKQKNKIESLIAEFEYACNTSDIEAILNTITPKVSDKIKLAFGIYGMFSDQDTSEVLDSISEAIVGDSELDGKDFLSSIKIDVGDITIDEENAVVKAKVQYVIAGEEYKKDAEFKCVYYLEEWYISSLKLN